MSMVYLARDPALRRSVAVKVMRPMLSVDPAARARFEREMRVIAMLSHPNIVSIHARGTLSDESPYFVMQYVDGPSLEARLAEEKPLPIREVRSILGQVASALAAAHRKGIIHRDIKPSNILINIEDGRALVTDFGISALRGAQENLVADKLTEAGVLVGTPRYMSPEQLLAEEVTDRSDIYALGLLGFELVAKRPAFQGTTVQALIAAHLRDTPPPVSTVRPDVDPELESLIARCLAKEPQDRPTATEIVGRLLPRGASVLEWPPPGIGLELGGLRKATRCFWAGSASILLPSILLGLTGGAEDQRASIWTGPIIYVLAALGIGSLVLGLHRAIGFLRVGARATRAGYAARTVLEVLCDHRGDTGLLITASREYAVLRDRVRGVIRGARVGREVLVLVAGCLPVPLYIFLVSALGGVGRQARVLEWLGIVFVVACLVLLLLLLIEPLSVGAVRSRIEGRPSDPNVADLAGTWRQSFQRFSSALGAAVGRPWHSTLVAGCILFAGLTAVIVSLFTLPIFYVGAFGSNVWDLARWAQDSNYETSATSLELLRPYAITPSDTISPMVAGEAQYALLAQLGRREGRFGSRWRQHTSSLEPFLGWPVIEEGQPATADQYAFPPPRLQALTDVEPQALSAKDIRYLRAISEHQIWRTFDRFALSRQSDYVAARFELPIADSLSMWDFPHPKFGGMKYLAYFNRARVSYFLAMGRPEAAAASAKKVISVGFKLVDHGFSSIDFLFGRVVVREGARQLARALHGSGSMEAKAIDSALDSLNAGSDPLSASSGGRLFSRSAPTRAALIAVASNPRLPQSLRVEALWSLSHAPCTNVPELLFGYRSDIQSAFYIAEAHLPVFASEREIYRLIRADAERIPPFAYLREFAGERLSYEPAFPALEFLARIGSAVTGNRRILGCLRLVSLAEALQSARVGR
jgi:hypothetical protein